MPRSLVASVVLAAALIAGGMLMQSGAWREARAVPATPRLLDEVRARILRDYVDSLSPNDLTERAAFGFVKELNDPYSVLLTPQQYQLLKEAASGRYAGIGIEIDMRDGLVTVVAALSGSPAVAAGIRAGDRLLSVGGRSTIGMSMEEVEQVLRGAAGSIVKVRIEHTGPAAVRADRPTLTIRREIIAYHPVRRAEMLARSIGYVQLATFSEGAAREIRRSVDSLRRAGARSLILDMRDNPGGLLEQGIDVADLFLGAGQTIASTRGRTADADHEYNDRSAEVWPGLPLVVAVDSGTASAAEIVAGALQDNKRGVIVGTRTYGKGSAQSVFPVVGGRALKLTTARWFTPNGRSIEPDSTPSGAGGGAGGGANASGDKRSRGAIVPDVITRDDAVINRAVELLTGVSTPADLRARVASTR